MQDVGYGVRRLWKNPAITLAAVFALGALSSVARGRTMRAVALCAGACWSKETAVVFAGVAGLVLDSV